MRQSVYNFMSLVFLKFNNFNGDKYPTHKYKYQSVLHVCMIYACSRQPQRGGCVPVVQSDGGGGRHADPGAVQV